MSGLAGESSAVCRPRRVPGEVMPPRCPSGEHGSKWGRSSKSAATPWGRQQSPRSTSRLALRQRRAELHGARWADRVFRLTVPETFAMVVGRWSDGSRPSTIWAKIFALTRSRHLIDGSLSLDGFRSGWMAAMAALGQQRTSADARGCIVLSAPWCRLLL